MDIVYLEVDGKVVGRLPDISYEKFLKLEDWVGVSDVAYAQYLRKHGMVRVTDYSHNRSMRLIVQEERESPEWKLYRQIFFSVVADTDNPDDSACLYGEDP